VVGYYGNSEVYGEVLSSSEEAIERILKLLKSGQRKSKIVRIGNGNPKLAAELAETLKIRAGVDLSIELVDESGTSAAIKPNIRVVRDVRSARLIAFRHGWKY
jgi:nucleoside-diphosphate-sugar epimerase